LYSKWNVQCEVSLCLHDVMMQRICESDDTASVQPVDARKTSNSAGKFYEQW